MYKLILALLLGVAAASAASLTVTLDNVSFSALPGSVVTVTGTIASDYGATVDLNSINISLGGDFTVDSSSFFAGPLTVSANGSTLNYTLFTLTPNDPFTFPYGLYTGTISILGGVEVGNVYDPNVYDLLGETQFNINVADPSTGIPEPATSALILMAAAGWGLYRRGTRT